MIIIGWLFYHMQSSNFKDLTLSKMQINASRLASKIIYAHMQYLPIQRSQLKVERGLHFGLYDKDKNPIIAHMNAPVDFTKKFYKKNARNYLIDTSAAGHLGVVYIVIEEYILENAIRLLMQDILMYLGIAFPITSLLGYF